MAPYPEQWEIKRVVDQETGLAVHWVRDEPPMERQAHFRLLFRGMEIPFSASYEYGNERVMRENRGRRGDAPADPASSSDVILYTAINIAGDFDRDRFIEIWHQLLSRRYGSCSVGARYLERSGGGPWRTWSKGYEPGPEP